MRAFDFDHTIYQGYSYRDFVLFIAARRPWMLLWLPVALIAVLLKFCRILKMKHLVEWVLFPMPDGPMKAHPFIPVATHEECTATVL